MSPRIRNLVPVMTRCSAVFTITLTMGVVAIGSTAVASPAERADRAGIGSLTGTQPTDDRDPVISLQATTPGFADYYLRHSDNQGGIAPVNARSSAADRGAATWIARRGLADSMCVSFESRNLPGRYLRHSSLRLVLQRPDGSKLFREDATFCAHQGKNGTGVSFASGNYSDRYIRHYQFGVYLASNGGPNPFDISLQWANDVSWKVAEPCAP